MTSFSKSRSPRTERFAVTCRMHAFRRMQKNIRPDKKMTDRNESFFRPRRKVNTATEATFDHLWDGNVFKEDCFMVCGLNAPGAWRHFCDVAHTNGSKDALWLVHDLYAWSPSPTPSKALPLPLDLDEPPETWKALKIKKVLFFGQSRHDEQIWKDWALTRGLGLARVLPDTHKAQPVQMNSFNRQSL
jgi:hypothetical protein